MSETFIRHVMVTLLLLLTAFMGYDYVQLALYSGSEPHPVKARGDLASMERTAIEVFEKVAPSVVFVTTVEMAGMNLFGHGRAKVGMGSGFVWDGAGHIVTNHHVVQAVDQIGVRFGADSMHRAAVVGSAPQYDLAVLRVNGINRTYTPVPIGSSRDLRVGQAVFAIGNPYGLSRTLTQGMVSALERRLPTQSGRKIGGVIQTDATINPGNSGGPLLDSAGRLIGVNTAIMSGNGSFAGVGFAVPVDTVNRVVSTIIREGRMPQPGLGITALGEQAAARMDVDGVVIVDTLPNSPAAEAGLTGVDSDSGRLGDVITHVEGERVHTVEQLAVLLEKTEIGATVTLNVEREGESRRVQVGLTDISLLPVHAD